MRRLVALLVILLVLGVAWTAGWFALAAWFDGKASDGLARLQDRGVSVNCSGRRIAGYPFALRLVCGDTTVADSHNGGAARIGGLSGGASVFAPMTARIALASPAHLDSPLMPGGADAKWQDAMLSVGVGMNGPRNLSFGAQDLAANLPGVSVSAKRFNGLLVPSGAGTAATVSFAGLALTRAGTPSPVVDGEAGAELPVPPLALMSGKGALKPPFAVHAMHAVLSSGAVRLQTEGDLSVDAEGIVDGAITLRIAGADALPGLIASLPPEGQKIGNAVAGALLAFGHPTTLQGAPASELLIEIKHGKAKVGPVEVHVPRLPVRNRSS